MAIIMRDLGNKGHNLGGNKWENVEVSRSKKYSGNHMYMCANTYLYPTYVYTQVDVVILPTTFIWDVITSTGSFSIIKMSGFNTNRRRIPTWIVQNRHINSFTHVDKRCGTCSARWYTRYVVWRWKNVSFWSDKIRVIWLHRSISASARKGKKKKS